ncbi:hypothetical protein Goshw_013775, partial [Gossypium schwendimanii]|nr:hypothetical protein [Gossypium schwendimanii]
MIGIQTGLPLPSVWEILSQLTNVHRVHHEYAAPIGFAAPYAHWLEILILGIPCNCSGTYDHILAVDSFTANRSNRDTQW